jgi:hypothetical protein
VDPVEIVVDIAGDAAATLVSTVVGVLPVLIPVFAAFWGIRYALSKLKINRAGKP